MPKTSLQLVNSQFVGCLLATSLFITGCSSQQPLLGQGSLPPVVLSPTNDAQVFYQALDSMILPPKTPQVAPEGVPDGPYSGIMEDGQEYKTFIKNGYFDENLVIYYPNFVTHLRTDLVNGLYDGWVTIRLPTGIVKQKALFKEGIVQEAILYNEVGKPAFHFWFTNEQPTSGIRYDDSGRAVESMM